MNRFTCTVTFDVEVDAPTEEEAIELVENTCIPYESKRVIVKVTDIEDIDRAYECADIIHERRMGERR